MAKEVSQTNSVSRSRHILLPSQTKKAEMTRAMGQKTMASNSMKDFGRLPRVYRVHRPLSWLSLKAS
jgi:hypothetical protein